MVLIDKSNKLLKQNIIMSKKSLLSSLFIKCLIFLSSSFYSCGNATVEQTANQNRSSEIEEHVVEHVVEDNIDDRNTEKVVKQVYAEYSAPGAIIKNTSVPIKSLFEYDRQGRKIIEQVESCASSMGCMKFISWFDSLGRTTKMESYTDNKLSVFQENTYNPDGELNQEFRIEHYEGKVDTILYEYHYGRKRRSKPQIAFRTNNKDTVARITILKEGNKEFRTIAAYPDRGFTSITNTETLNNKNGKPIEIRTEIISESWRDKTKMDTTVTVAKMAYNEAGLVTEETKLHLDDQVSEKYTTSYLHGAIRTKKIQKGRQAYTINFRQVYW